MSNERVILCKECFKFLVSEDKKTATDYHNTWPSFFWGLLKNERVQQIYRTQLWQLIPLEWRPWWINKVKTIAIFNEVTISTPSSIFLDRSSDIIQFKNNFESYKISELISSCNNFMMPDILCPWGCTEYIHKPGYIESDLLFQRYLPKCKLVLSNNHLKCKFVESSRDDFIRFCNKYDNWLFNPNWKIKPSIAFVKGKGPMILTCRNHDCGTEKIYLHPPSQPNCQYSSFSNW